MASIKLFNKKTLQKANEIAAKRNYNRQIDDKFLNLLPDDLVFPVVFTMIHEHAQGYRVDPHIRCWVELDSEGNRVFIDCDTKLYKSLPSVEVPEKKEDSQ